MKSALPLCTKPPASVAVDVPIHPFADPFPANTIARPTILMITRHARAVPREPCAHAVSALHLPAILCRKRVKDIPDWHATRSILALVFIHALHCALCTSISRLAQQCAQQQHNAGGGIGDMRAYLFLRLVRMSLYMCK